MSRHARSSKSGLGDIKKTVFARRLFAMIRSGLKTAAFCFVSNLQRSRVRRRLTLTPIEELGIYCAAALKRSRGLRDQEIKNHLLSG